MSLLLLFNELILFFNFSVLICNVINVNRYYPPKQKLFDMLINFEATKGILPPKRMRALGLSCPFKYLLIGPGLRQVEG